MSERHACPSCGGPRGVMLFSHVAPCDDCVSGGPPEYSMDVVALDDMPGVLGRTAGFLAYVTMSDAEVAARRDRPYVTKHRGPLHAGDGLGDVVRLNAGSPGYWHPRQFDRVICDHPSMRYFVVILRGGKQTLRPARAVCRIPDRWHGAPGSWSWAEGRDVTMVLEVDDVPVERVLHCWVPCEYSSAYDCSADKLERVAKSHVCNSAYWTMALPALKREDAACLLRNDRFLLFVRR